MAKFFIVDKLAKVLFMNLRLLILAALTFFNANSFAQNDKWLRAFPITDYILNGNDSIKIVQLEMPEGIKLKDNQLGIVKGVYENKHSDTVSKGYGRCNLIKGNYYYFGIIDNNSGEILKKGDLIYTLMDKADIWYEQVAKLAGHFIRLQSVYETPFYDRYLIFNHWTEEDEINLIDSVVNDIRFTGSYFLENDPSMNKIINAGDYKGQKVLTVMANCRKKDVNDFFDYIIARPRLYAGRNWKVSEIFATWLAEGAPKVIK